jgi:RNA polymerase sigma-70 factor, ECF subfamily
MTENATFADRVAQHLPCLTRLVHSRMRGDAASDDIVQQTVLKALIHADQFRNEADLKTWLVSIAMNEVRQLYRCKWRACSAPLLLEHFESPRYANNDCPERSYQREERNALLRHAVSRLPESYRCVVELCDLERLTEKETAAKLRLTVETVKTRRHRGRKKLQPYVTELSR